MIGTATRLPQGTEFATPPRFAAPKRFPEELTREAVSVSKGRPARSHSRYRAAYSSTRLRKRVLMSGSSARLWSEFGYVSSSCGMPAAES